MSMSLNALRISPCQVILTFMKITGVILESNVTIQLTKTNNRSITFFSCGSVI